MKNQIIVICIDGFDPEYFDYIDIPNINKLINNGFYKIIKSMWPSVTNVNNVSIITGEYPNIHGICSNYRYIKDTKEEVYMESNEYILCQTIFNLTNNKEIKTLLATSKDKLRTLLSTDSTYIISSEKPKKWLVDILGNPPSIYSIKLNKWTIDAARIAIKKYKPDFTYISTTDAIMHKYPANSEESILHFQMLDESIGQILNDNPNATIFITADHGMSNKTRLIDLGLILNQYNIKNYSVPIIKDRYTAHHSNLGGAFNIYVNDNHIEKSLNILKNIDGVDRVLDSNTASEVYKLHKERIGQIIVSGAKDTVFGDTSKIKLPKGLRSHGSEHEMDIPLIAYNLSNTKYKFNENIDIGKYVINQFEL